MLNPPAKIKVKTFDMKYNIINFQDDKARFISFIFTYDEQNLLKIVHIKQAIVCKQTNVLNSID